MNDLKRLTLPVLFILLQNVCCRSGQILRSPLPEHFPIIQNKCYQNVCILKKLRFADYVKSVSSVISEFPGMVPGCA